MTSAASTRQYIRLDGHTTCIVLECCATEAPIWRYWGPLLAPVDTVFTMRDGRPIPPASMDSDQPLSIAPTFGVGWFGQSALLAHRRGRQFAQQWTQCDITKHDAHQVLFTLSDPVAAIQLVINIALHVGSDMLRLQSTLHNRGEDELDVQWLAAGTLMLPPEMYAVRSFFGVWANELQVQIEPLARSQWRRETRRGRSAHDDFPGAVVTSPTTNEHTGLAYGAHLGWSGNHMQLIEALDDGHYQWQMGEWLSPGEVRLARGEALASPTLYAACSTTGMNGLAQQFHALIRSTVPWHQATIRSRPVHLNTWEAVYFDHREEDLMSLATSAAELGVERFVLDDGWFSGRNSDRMGLGDWWPDPNKYPQGLLPLANHVISNNMEFGLWIEPEMVNPDSALYREHADWALAIEGRPMLTARNQLVLDLGRADVINYLFDHVSVLLKSVPISYLKWDMNRDLTTAANAGGYAAYRTRTHALYSLLARIREAFPALEIESCASGGGRIDAGILAHTHRVWTSDCNDATARVTIQRHALQWLPPEIMGAHIGSAPSHTTGRSQSLSFRAAVALPGHLGLEMDVRKLSDDDRTLLAKWIALYRALRNELHGVPVWCGSCGDSVVWQAHGDQQSMVVLVYRLEPTKQRHAPALKLPMLDVARDYAIKRLDQFADVSSTINNNATMFAALASTGINMHGGWLVNKGLPLPRMLAESALVLKFICQ
jgi:alpha-galactosidase